jgi:hypothetical protein
LDTASQSAARAEMLSRERTTHGYSGSAGSRRKENHARAGQAFVEQVHVA